MGASISQRPGKCLKNRRTKSEEYLGSQHNLRDNMGRFFTPWHNIICGNINRDNSKYLDYSKDFTDFTCDMEKSFKEIHRSNSLDKSSFEKDYEKLVLDNYADNFIINDELSLSQHCNRRLTIDVNKDSIFEVNLRKGTRGLGFSVLEYDGFIFIKQLFPLEAASQSGLLQEGDIILSANGTALTDLNSFEALQILRKLDNPVTLIVCRLQQFLNKKPSTFSHVFSKFTTLTYNNPLHNEFEIKMKKVNGSLGFTLRKDEDGDCCHVVRALVKKPAISDGRIKPGDQIISVNDQEIGGMTHQEAVKFLRDCDEEVLLKLRRDTLSSSLTSLNSSHFEDNNKTLRKEALEMLNTLAVKKLKADSAEDKQNNNSKFEANLQLDSGLMLKKKDSLFSSRENLSALLPDDDVVQSMHDNDIVNNLAEIADEPVSLPALDVSSDKISFQHNDPAYHSINVPNFTSKNSEDTFSQTRISPVPQMENKGLLKWKGVVLDSENGKASENPSEEIVVVQLQRGWNSRLGFSLSSRNDSTVISAIHADSVAAKDGRLKINDKMVEINGKNVENLQTAEIIETLRTIRGTVTIKVIRNSLKF